MRIILKNMNWILLLLAAALLVHLRGFFLLYQDQLFLLTYQHLRLILWAMPPAIALGLGVGMLVYSRPGLAALFTSAAGIVFTIPSIALFGAMIPFLSPLGAGVGILPAILALLLYSQLPIIRNTCVGLNQVPGATIKAARGMGLTEAQVMWRVRLPMALPVIMAGIRTAVVLSVGIAAVAAYIGAGGLGRWIFGGIRRTYPDMMLAGAVVVSLMAIALDGVGALLQKVFTPGKHLLSENR